MSKRIIIISGSGGSGKETAARKLLSKIDSSAWIDIKHLTKTNPWEYSDEMKMLGTKNMCSLAGNFFEEGYGTVLVSGGFTAQKYVDFLEEYFSDINYQVTYIWLEADKGVRDKRRIDRSRDDADKPEHLDNVDKVFFDPGEIKLKKGKYSKIDTSSKSKDEVVESLLNFITQE